MVLCVLGRYLHVLVKDSSRQKITFAFQHRPPYFDFTPIHLQELLKVPFLHGQDERMERLPNHNKFLGLCDLFCAFLCFLKYSRFIVSTFALQTIWNMWRQETSCWQVSEIFETGINFENQFWTKKRRKSTGKAKKLVVEIERESLKNPHRNGKIKKEWCRKSSSGLSLKQNWCSHLKVKKTFKCYLYVRTKRHIWNIIFMKHNSHLLPRTRATRPRSHLNFLVLTKFPAQCAMTWFLPICWQ